MGRGRSKKTHRPDATTAPDTSLTPASHKVASEPASTPPTPAPRASAPATPEPALALHLDEPLFGSGLRWPRWLVPPTDRWPLLAFALALVVVYAIGVLLRMKWLMDFGWDAAPVQWHGTPLLTSSDGYYFAAGVDVAVTGESGLRTRIPGAGDNALVAFGWLCAKLFGASVDDVALYTPAFLGPLIIVPIAAMARTLGRSALGVLAALVVLVTPGYFMRTTAGYFDSDPFAVAVPLVAVACFVRLFADAAHAARAPGEARPPRGYWGVAGSAVLGAYPYFYDQGGPIGLATAALTILYLLVFHRRERWAHPLVAGLGLGQLALPWTVTFALALLVPLAFLAVRLPSWLARGLPIALALAGLLLSPTWQILWMKLALFSGKGSAIIGSDSGAEDVGDPIFKDSTRFVAEAQKIALGDIGSRIIGSLALAILAIAGIVVAALRVRSLALLAPVAAVGLFSIIGGLRFTIYLSPVAAFGAAWLVAAVSHLAPRGLARAAAVVVLGAAITWPGLSVVWVARPRPSVIAPEVDLLAQLGSRIKPGDSVVGWWDYGYAISYFSRARTVVDGGRRFQDANLVAEMLLGSSQRAAANLARLTAQRLAKHPDFSAAPRMFRDARDAGLGPAAFLASLDKPEAKVPPDEHDIYFYLPARMLNILPALDALRPTEPGQTRPPPRGAPPVLAKADGERLVLPQNTVVDGKTMTMKSPRGERPLKRIYSITAGGVGKAAEVRQRDGKKDANTSGIFLRGVSIFAEMDDRLIASVFVQLFAFEKPDPAVFELVLANDAAKIYRLRR